MPARSTRATCWRSSICSSTRKPARSTSTGPTKSSPGRSSASKERSCDWRHRPQHCGSHRLCPCRVRRVSRGLERDAGAAYAADERHQRDQLRDCRRRHPRGWPGRHGHGRAAGHDCRCAGRRQHLRRLPRQPADVGDVQEKGTQTTNYQPPTTNQNMTANQVALAYLLASILFILSLRGLSHPLSARRGNLFGMIGMALAILTTLAVSRRIDLAIGALAVGAVIGIIVSRRVQMTQMPELVAAMHSLVGLAAVLIAFAVVNDPSAFNIEVPIPAGNRMELFIGTFIGAVTFTGSIIAFGKLAGLGKYSRLFSSAPVVFMGQHFLNLLFVLFMIGNGLLFFTATPDRQWPPFITMTGTAFLLGVLTIIPIGGADMPVVISMLNSYSGWAAAGIGFSLNNSMLIIAGSLVGSSRAILSYIMCKAMNRSFISVILGGFGAAEGAAAAGSEDRTVRSGSAEDAAFLMANAEKVTIAAGYGLAGAGAQHAVKGMAERLKGKGL